MNIIINNVDFWDNFAPMRYWAPPKTYDSIKWSNEVKNYMLSNEYIGARKVDGFWSMIIKDGEGAYHLRSRTKNVNGTYVDKIEWIPWIVEDLKKLPNNTVLLGEIYLKNKEGSKNTTSILNCLKEKALKRQRDKEPLHFYIFDCLAFNNKILLDIPIEKRITLIYEDIQPIISTNYIEIANYVKGEKLWDTCCKILEDGYEGMVIQNKNAKYTCGKRQARLSIKVKKEIEQTIDAFLDGQYEPPTKLYSGKAPETWKYWFNDKTGEKTTDNMYKNYCAGEPWIPITKAYFNGWAAAVSFSVLKDGKPVRIGWISGIDETLRNGIVNEPDKWINKVAELTCMELEKSGNFYTMRHGKIKQWRKDKDWKDCEFNQIK